MFFFFSFVCLMFPWTITQAQSPKKTSKKIKKEKKQSVILAIHHPIEDSYREVELKEQEIIHIRGDYYLSVYKIIWPVETTMNFQTIQRTEVYVKIFQQKKNGSQHFIWDGWLSSWPKERPFQQQDILKTVGVLFFLKEK